MKRHYTAKKFVAKLPEDFQEVLMASEMELQEGLTVPILRKLVYLYTRGMQYYDLVHKDKFRQFYSDKLVSLLTRKDVEQFLDKNPINFEDKKDLDKLFSIPQNKMTSLQTTLNQPKSNVQAPQPQIESGKKDPVKDYNINQYFRDFSNKIRRNSTALVRKKINTVDISLLVKQKILEVSTNLNKIDKAMTNEVIEQMTEFETNKRQREVRPSPYIINQKEKIEKKEKEEEKNNDSNSENSNSEEEKNNNNVINSPEDELKILELSGVTKEKKEEDKELSNNNALKHLIGNNPMLREIELYVQKNMDEMYQAFEELKASFEDEIKEAEENGFDDIAEGLKEDLQNELDNLKDQYEEQRRIETEKIKLKYSKRNSLFVG